MASPVFDKREIYFPNCDYSKRKQLPFKCAAARPANQQDYGIIYR